jgi:hypothetical protein
LYVHPPSSKKYLLLEFPNDLAQRLNISLTYSEALWLGWTLFEKFVRLYVTFEA